MAELTYRYRIYPTEKQADKIKKNSDYARFVYNQLLTDRTKQFRKTKTWMKLSLEQLLKEYRFLKYADRGALVWAMNSLEQSYRTFFYVEKTQPDQYRPEAVEKSRKDPAYVLMDTDLKCYPRFKKKKHGPEGYTTNLSALEFQDGKVLLPSLGAVRIKYHRKLMHDSQIVSCTIRKTPSGRYFLLLRVAFDKPTEIPGDKALGVVFDDKDFAVRSDGKQIEKIPVDEGLEKQIHKAYQTLKRRVPGSKGYEEQYRRLSSLLEKKVERRRDWLHKNARTIAKAADVVYVTQPYVREKVVRLETAQQRRELLDQARFTMYQFIRYKTELQGKRFVGVPKGYPMHTCAVCGAVQAEVRDGQRTCLTCGAEMTVSENAARNVQKLAEKHIQERKTMQIQ